MDDQRRADAREFVNEALRQAEAEDHEGLGETLEKLRKCLGYSPTEIARAMNISVATWHRWCGGERGKKIGSVRLLLEIPELSEHAPERDLATYHDKRQGIDVLLGVRDEDYILRLEAIAKRIVLVKYREPFLSGDPDRGTHVRAQMLRLLEKSDDARPTFYFVYPENPTKRGAKFTPQDSYEEFLSEASKYFEAKDEGFVGRHVRGLPQKPLPDRHFLAPQALSTIALQFIEKRPPEVFVELPIARYIAGLAPKPVRADAAQRYWAELPREAAEAWWDRHEPEFDKNDDEVAGKIGQNSENGQEAP